MMLYLEQVGIVSRKVTQQCKVEKILGSVQNTIVFSVFRPWQCDWEWVVHWTQNLQEAVRQDVDWPRRWPHAPSRITKSEHHLARCKADQGGYSEKRPCPSNHVPLLWHNHLNQISFGYPPENLKGCRHSLIEEGGEAIRLSWEFCTSSLCEILPQLHMVPKGARVHMIWEVG